MAKRGYGTVGTLDGINEQELWRLFSCKNTGQIHFQSGGEKCICKSGGEV
jgi:hypothetical protein